MDELKELVENLASIQETEHESTKPPNPDIIQTSLGFLTEYSRLLLPQLAVILPDLIIAGIKHWVDAQNDKSRRVGGSTRQKRVKSEQLRNTGKSPKVSPKVSPKASQFKTASSPKRTPVTQNAATNKNSLIKSAPPTKSAPPKKSASPPKSIPPKKSIPTKSLPTKGPFQNSVVVDNLWVPKS